MINLQFPEKFQSLFTPNRCKVYMGGRGSGKSMAVAQYVLIKGMESNINIVCGREFQASIKDSVHSMLKDIISSNEQLSAFYEVTHTDIRGRNGTQIMFVGLARNINSIKSMHEIKIFWCEESQTLSRNSLEILFPTVRAEGSELKFTMNPILEEDPAYQILVEKALPEWTVEKVNYIDNPFFPEVLRKEMEHMKKNDYHRYLHIWEGNPVIAVEGAILAEHLIRAKDEHRIKDIPYDDRYPVSVYLDIGWADNTSIWFLQIINHELRVIDCYQAQFQKTPHYIRVLKAKGYIYNHIVLPHDASHNHAEADFTWIQQFKNAFHNVRIRIGKPLEGEIKIRSVHTMFDMMYFDKEKCADGLSALGKWRFLKATTGRVSREPFHGDESHFCDAFAYLCADLNMVTRKPTVENDLMNLKKLEGRPVWAR